MSYEISLQDAFGSSNTIRWSSSHKTYITNKVLTYRWSDRTTSVKIWSWSLMMYKDHVEDRTGLDELQGPKPVHAIYQIWVLPNMVWVQEQIYITIYALAVRIIIGVFKVSFCPSIPLRYLQPEKSPKSDHKFHKSCVCNSMSHCSSAAHISIDKVSEEIWMTWEVIT